MICNIGNGERLARIVAGLSIITAGVLLQTWWGILGLIPLLTGMSGWCPIYVPFGISTKGESLN